MVTVPGDQTGSPEVFISYGRLARGPQPDPAVGEVTLRAWRARGVTLGLLAPLEAALRALLPFSRNDFWEVSELKQRLGHR